MTMIMTSAATDLLKTLTSGRNPNKVAATNLDDPAVHLLALGLVDVDGDELRATQAGYELRETIDGHD
jgi:hypothetical protein